jgi:CHAT domain-containing protein/tetratricopeptide (TPR) repeat protein
MQSPRKLATLGIAILVLILVGWGVYCYIAIQLSKSPVPEQEKLVQALKGQRPVEGRLSWGFTHAPYKEASEGVLPNGKDPASASTRFLPPLRGATEPERELERTISAQNSPEALSAKGILYLVHHEAARAVRELDKAAKLAPSDARIRSDLSAALLARSREKGDPHDLALALATADQAVALDRQLPEAHFNRALALEKLFLLFPAQAAWEDYLQLDSRSDWGSEAKNHLAALSQPSPAVVWNELSSLLDRPDTDQGTLEEIVKRFPQEARQYAEDSLLGSWADRFLKGEHEQAENTLNAARRLGATLAVQLGEHMPADAVATIDRALSSKGDREKVTFLAEGHRAYRDGRLLDKEFRAPEARPLFDRAHQAFSRGQSPAAALASLYLAIGYYQQYKYKRAFQVLDGYLPEETANGRHSGLLGRSYWLVGLMQLGNGEPSLSLVAYQRALSAMNRTGGAEGIAGVHAAMAETLRYLGQPREAWAHLYKALASTQSIGSVRRKEAILGELAETCETGGEWSVARYFRGEGVLIAKDSKDPALLAQALLRSSRSLRQVGEESAAEAALTEARQALDRIPDETLRRRTDADLLIAESVVRPTDARDSLAQALAFFEGQKNHFLVSALLLTRARASLAAGDEESAEEDLRQGINEYETQRSHVSEEDLKISFFDGAEGLFHEMIRLQAIDLGHAEVALDFAERSKARALLDRLGPITRQQKQEVIAGLTEPLTSEEVRSRLPEGTSIIEYALLEDRTLIWVIRRNGIQLQEAPTGSQAVNTLAEQLLTSIVRRRTLAERAASSALYDLVIRPVLPHLGPQETLVFVPDQGLYNVPFAALFDKATRRYLLEDHVITVAPSATLTVEASGQGHTLRAGPTALVVGNPTFRKDLGQQLVNLPHAEQEAKEIGKLLPGSEILIRESATKDRFLEAAGHSEIIHFGGHAVINQEFPLLSYLVMSPETPADPGLLYAHELYSAHFESSGLAVLAACDTASGPLHGEGIVSFARAFLATGVPSVIASLWSVGDEETEKLWRTFYSELQLGVSPAAALRRAQMTLLSQSNSRLHSAATWGAFECLGSPAALKTSRGVNLNHD